MSLPTRADAVVIGAGVVGSATAHALARRGAHVVVLDAAPGIGGGCSYANAALLAPSHVAPLATPSALVDASRQLGRRPPAVWVYADATVVPWLARLTKAAGSNRVRRAASRLRDLATWSAALHAQLHEAGLSPTYAPIGSLDVYLRRPGRYASGRRRLLDAQALRRLEPALGNVRAGTHHPDEAVTESRSFVTAMLDAARGHGASVHFGRAVREIVTRDGAVAGVRTDDGVIETERVVVAAGLGAAPLAADLGVRLPLRGGRGYVVDLARWDDAPRCAVRLKEHRVVVTPLADRVRVAGYLEFGAEGRPIDHRRSRQLVAVATRALPGLEGRAVLDEWTGERPCLRDGLPAIGASRALGGVSFTVGHGMWGLILAPATGELVAGQLLASATTHIPAEFHPDRFA